MIEQFWLFHCGYSLTPASLIVRGGGMSMIRIPYLSALLVHSEHGLILIDAPFGREGPANLGAVLGAALRTFGTKFKPAWSVVERVRECGFRASDVSNVLMTHLHFDHTGGMKNVAHATFHVNETEWDFAMNEGSFTQGYVKNDYRALQHVETFSGESLDLFGDGSVETIPTPGHSPGHTGFRISLTTGESFVFFGDAAFTVAQITQSEELGPFPRSAAFDLDLAQQTLNELRGTDFGETLITAHDPEWGERCRRAPIPLHAENES